jgi:hypothetical protein
MASCSYDPPAESTAFRPSTKISSSNFNGSFKNFDWVSATHYHDCNSGSYVTGSTACNSTLRTSLSRSFSAMDYYSRYFGSGGRLSWIGSHGIARYPDNDGKAEKSYHYHCEAMDISWIHFDNTHVNVCNTNPDDSNYNYGIRYTSRRRRYLACEAALRRHHGYVLNYEIPNHENHFHVDNADGSCPPGFHAQQYSSSRKSTSVTYFVQHCVNDFTSYKTTADGIYGPDTVTKWKHLLVYMNLGCLTPWSNASHWQTFLTYIMMHGMRNVSAGHYKYNGCNGPQ